MSTEPPPPPSTNTPPPGWYPSPQDASSLQWWDGQQWTEHRAPAGKPPAPPEGAKGTTTHWLMPTGRSPWAIAAGYFALLSLLGIFAPLALICGIIGLVQIKRNPELGGKGRAWFGVIVGGLVSVLALTLIASD